MCADFFVLASLNGQSSYVGCCLQPSFAFRALFCPFLGSRSMVSFAVSRSIPGRGSAQDFRRKLIRNWRFAVRDLSAANAGSAAVEFALLVPFLMLFLFGIIGFGWFMGISHTLQEAASQSARASVAGLDFSERSAVALAIVRRRTSDNPLINADALTVNAGSDASNPDLFTVTLRYDMSANLLRAVPTFVPLPTMLTRTASIRRGGL